MAVLAGCGDGLPRPAATPNPPAYGHPLKRGKRGKPAGRGGEALKDEIVMCANVLSGLRWGI